MIYDLSDPNRLAIFKDQVSWFIEQGKKVNLELHKTTRSNLQSRSRWLYLTQIADILNERGETFTPLGTKLIVKYTKDNLYYNYWKPLQENLYPGVKRLDTKQFSELVELSLMLFAKVHSISIPFPNREQLLNR